MQEKENENALLAVIVTAGVWMKVCTKLNYVSTPICLWISFYFYHLGSEERKFVNGLFFATK